MIVLLLLQLAASTPRLYKSLPIAKVATSQQTHIETCGQIVYRRLMPYDGDWHLTLALGEIKVVLEFVPAVVALMLPAATWRTLIVTPQDNARIPAKNQWITVGGIKRVDEAHNWPEIHPVEWWLPAKVGCVP